MAGRDTTAVALTWATYYMMTVPGVAEKVAEEVEGVAGKVTGPVDPDRLTSDQILDLKYTWAVMRETLRLQPPVPLNTKSCKEDCTLPGETTVNTHIFCNKPMQNLLWNFRLLALRQVVKISVI
jgi:cytochrome P450